MKHFLKGAAAMAIVMVVDIVVNVILNMQGIELNATAMAFATAMLALALYHFFIRNEKEQ